MRLLYKVIITLALVLMAVLVANPAEIGDALEGVEWALIGLVIALYLLNTIVKAYRWTVLLRAADVELPFPVVLKSFTMGLAIDNVTPGGFAGEAARVYHLNRSEDLEIGSGVATVAAESVMDIVAVTLVGVVGMLFFIPLLLEGEMNVLLFVLIIATVINVLAIYALARPHLIERMTDWLAKQVPKVIKGKLGAKLGEQIDAFGDSFHASLKLDSAKRKKAIWEGSVLTVLIWGNECVRFTLILAALGTEMDLAATMVIVSLSWIVSNVLVAGLSNLVVATSVLAAIGIDLELAKTAGILSALTSKWISIPLGIIAIVLIERRGRAGNVHIVADDREKE